MKISDISKKLTIEWAKDAKIICISEKKFCEFIHNLAKSNAQGYVFCQNEYNKKSYPERITMLSGVTNEKKWHTQKVNWTVEEKNGEYCAFLRTPAGLFKIYTPQYKRAETIGGYRGLKMLSANTKKLTGKTFYQIVGRLDGVKNPDAMHFFKFCQYRQLIFCDTASTYKILPNFYKIDRSSAYPSEGYTFPNFKTLEFFENEKDFQKSKKKFAFFEKSGRVVEKGVFDSREVLENKWYGGIYPEEKEKHANPDGRIWAFDETENIGEVWQMLFDARKFNDEIKSGMVSCIGFMQSEKYAKKTYLGHCSAVIYLRHIKKMLKKIEEIERAGGKIVIIATDAVGWIGGDLKKIKCNTGEKKMGTFQLEIKKAIACIKCNGVYAWQDEQKKITVKHQGVKGPVMIANILDVLKLEPQVAVLEPKTVNGLIVPEYKKICMSNEKLVMIDSDGG